MSDYDYLFRVFLAGDSGVGKSSLIVRFVDDTFSDHFTSTIGLDFKIHTVTVEDKVVKLQYWDTAGQERFRAVVSTTYKSAHGVVLVYDVTNHDSFTNVQKWLELIDKQCRDDVKKLLVGNKCDLASKRVVDYQTAQDYADELGIPYIETSAKNATNVEQTFMKLAVEIKNGIGPSTDPVSAAEKVQINSRPVQKGMFSCNC